MRIYAKVVLSLVAAVLSIDAMAKSLTGAEEVTCGQEIAADSEVPEKLAQLMSHVAANMEAHAKWVAGSAGGKLEHDRLMLVAREYESIAAAAGRAASAMKSMQSIPPVQHDPSQLDRAGQARWMRSRIAMQLELARLLTRHAEVSKKVLAEMEGK